MPFTVLQGMGLAVLVAAVILSNVAVRKMAKLVHVHWRVKSDWAAFEAIGKYRKQYGNGPLFWNLVVAYGLVVIGGVMLVAGR